MNNLSTSIVIHSAFPEQVSIARANMSTLASTRTRRENAGNRMQALLAGQYALEEEEVFEEVVGDEEFQGESHTKWSCDQGHRSPHWLLCTADVICQSGFLTSTTRAKLTSASFPPSFLLIANACPLHSCRRRSRYLRFRLCLNRRRG